MADRPNLMRWFAGRVDPEQPADGPPPQTVGRYFLWAFRGGWSTAGVGTIVTMIGGGVEVLTFAMLGWIVDLAIEADPETLWSDNWPLLVGFVALMLVIRPLLLGLGTAFTSVALSPSLHNLHLSRLHRYTLGHSMTYFDNDFAGRIAQKESQTTVSSVDVVHEGINAISYALASVLAALVLVGAISGWLVAVVLAWMVLLGFLLRYFLPRLRALSEDRANERAALTGQIVDTITNAKTVKLFAGADREDQAAVGALRTFRASALNWATETVRFRIGLITVAGTLPTAVVGVGLWAWQRGGATVGMVAAATAVAIRLSQMSGWISWTLMMIFSNVGEVEDGVKTLTPSYGLTDADDAVELRVDEPSVVFDGVSFRYGQPTGGVEEVTLSIAPGEKLGLVGPSGAGKSTLLALTLRLHDPESGRVLVSDQDLRGVTQNSLRSQISMVTQETAMFNRSAFENIRYGRPDADHDQVVAAARQAEAHQFIGELEDFKGRVGYQAHLGERGVKLSGGQRQRIALARALLKDAPILLLDEATSALDSEIEAQIQSALANAMEGKTVVAAAHRLSTLNRMDRIVVMDQGHIIEEGTHGQLLDLGGVYARLWSRQTGGFLNYA
jgi:ATP-binding cassette subfamily B protein